MAFPISRTSLVSLLCLLSWLPHALAQAASTPGERAQIDGLEILKSLAGDWVSNVEDQSAITVVSYRIISNVNAVLEWVKPSDPKQQVLTVFHREGGKLVLTRYSAGGEFRMEADLHPVGNRLEFRLPEARRLRSDPDNRSFAISVSDWGHLIEEWKLRAHGNAESVVVRYTRAVNYTSP